MDSEGAEVVDRNWGGEVAFFAEEIVEERLAEADGGFDDQKLKRGELVTGVDNFEITGETLGSGADPDGEIAVMVLTVGTKKKIPGSFDIEGDGEGLDGEGLAVGLGVEMIKELFFVREEHARLDDEIGINTGGVVAGDET